MYWKRFLYSDNNTFWKRFQSLFCFFCQFSLLHNLLSPFLCRIYKSLLFFVGILLPLSQFVNKKEHQPTLMPFLIKELRYIIHLQIKLIPHSPDCFNIRPFLPQLTSKLFYMGINRSCIPKIIIIPNVI